MVLLIKANHDPYQKKKIKLIMIWF